ncbi:endoglucanase V-like protein [Infundibulicybe gibba]|nr:endoglucanase V-like protein [Infundibulicybe gibba]
MKLVFICSLLFSATLTRGFAQRDEQATGGYIQHATGSASFTRYADCSQAACGQTARGYTAAINQLAYGASAGLGAGDACGRCFAITGTGDPYSPDYQGSFKSIVVKVTDLCPIEGNEEWCGQTQSNPKNEHSQPFHIDICEDTGGADAFFPEGHGALTGTFEEVPCSEWSGSDGEQLWEGSCLKDDKK